MDQFRAQKAALEQTLDAVVETAEELALVQYVSSAQEQLVTFPRTLEGSAGHRQGIQAVLAEAAMQLNAVRLRAEG